MIIFTISDSDARHKSNLTLYINIVIIWMYFPNYKFKRNIAVWNTLEFTWLNIKKLHYQALFPRYKNNQLKPLNPLRSEADPKISLLRGRWPTLQPRKHHFKCFRHIAALKHVNVFPSKHICHVHKYASLRQQL